MSAPSDVVLLPDSRPLIALAYAGALDLLFKPGWSVMLVDTVLHEITRNHTPTSGKLTRWAESNQLPARITRAFQHYLWTLAESADPSKSNLGELAIQESMIDFAPQRSPRTGVFLFEDHMIARARFLVPDNCRKVSA